MVEINQENITHFIKHPNEIDKDQLVILSELAEKHPYSSFINTLLAKVLHTHNHIKYDNQLQKAAFTITDRMVLYKYIQRKALLKKIDLTFIEVMPMEETDISREYQFTSLSDIFENLNIKYNFKQSNHSTGGPARYYTSNNLRTKIGFISPLTNNFCSSCNRVRISSTGKLFMCLGQNEYVDFRHIMRNDYSNDYIKEKIKFALKIKPKKHDFMIGTKINKYMKRHMNVTGG